MAGAAEGRGQARLAAQDAALLAAFILFLDGLAKALMSGYAPAHMGLSAEFWAATGLAQALASALIFAYFFRQAPRLEALTTCGIFMFGTLLFAPLLAWVHDFSADGQWYHLFRTLMVGGGSPDSLAALPIAGQPTSLPAARATAIYPLLPDNLRGVFLLPLGQGNPYQLVSMNLALLLAALAFWLRYATFLPSLARAALGISPIAVTQLFTFYIDGFIACVCSMLFLVSLLSLLEMRQAAGAGKGCPSAGLTWECLAVTSALLLQCKYSGAYVILLALLPFAASGQGREHLRALGALARGRGAALKALALCCLLFNPYAFTLLSALGLEAFNSFSVANISAILATIWLNMEAQYVDLPHWALFFKSHFLSLAPHGRPTSLSGAEALLVLALDPDIRFGGFGVLALTPLWAALLIALKLRFLGGKSRTDDQATFLARTLAAAFLLATVVLPFLPHAFGARYIPTYFLTALCLVAFWMLGWHAKRLRAGAFLLYLIWLLTPGLLAGALTAAKVNYANQHFTEYLGSLSATQQANLKIGWSPTSRHPEASAYLLSRSLGYLPAIAPPPVDSASATCDEVPKTPSLTFCLHKPP